MNALVVFVVLLAVLFTLSYITKRRFGVLGLALCAGSLLSASWATALTPWIEQQGVVVVSPPLSAIVSALLIILPPLLLLFSGPTYASFLPRVAGSAAFAMLAFVFLLAPLGLALILDSTGLHIYNLLTKSSNVISMLGIVAALVDILMTRTPRHAKKSG
jgi:hypothetical protein